MFQVKMYSWKVHLSTINLHQSIYDHLSYLSPSFHKSTLQLLSPSPSYLPSIPQFKNVSFFSDQLCFGRHCFFYLQLQIMCCYVARFDVKIMHMRLGLIKHIHTKPVGGGKK